MFLRIFKCSGEIEKKAINVDPPIIEILLLQSAQSFGGQLKKPKVSSGCFGDKGSNPTSDAKNEYFQGSFVLYFHHLKCLQQLNVV